MSKIFPAATVVLVRDGINGLETLLLHRSLAVSFASGSWVFPGGRIDKADYCDELGDIDAAARRAAIRETQEEAGLVISEAGLVYFAHWTTPPENSKRFATWFFICDVTANNGPVSVDGSEIVDHRWCTPQQALDDRQSKRITMMPPTFITLTELAQCETAEQSLTMYRHRPIPEFLPKFTTTDQGIAMLYPGDAGYEKGEPDTDGPRHRCWMLDEAWRYEKS